MGLKNLLLLKDRVNTTDLLRKHFHIESSTCVLCDECLVEDLLRLFFGCSFSQGFWWGIGIKWETDTPSVNKYKSV